MRRQDMARRLDELEAATARCTRVCAGLGWTEVELAKLMSGADFRDILRGEDFAAWEAEVS